MNFHICPNCRAKLNPKKIQRHFSKVHPGIALPEAQYLKNPLFNAESIILKSGLDRIYNDYLSFELKFRSLKRADYFEAIEIEYHRLYKEVDNYLDITSEEIKMNDDIFGQIMSCKCRIIEEIKGKLDQLRAEIPSYDQYIKAQYQTIYITWFDLTFDKNKIRISANKAFVKAIDLPTEIRSFKSLKVEFFRKNYSNAKYKLVIYRGVIMPELSRGLKEIQDLVSKHSSVISRNKRDLIYSEITCKYQRIV